MESAANRLSHIQERIERAARRAGRTPQDITLVAVTKTIPVENVVPFLQAGVREIGENRVQEAVEKYSGIRVQHRPPKEVLNSRCSPDYISIQGTGQSSGSPKLHLIGPLQSNKAKKAVEFFDMLQTLDRWELATELNRHAGARGKKLDCLVQLKISKEPTKSGLDPDLLPEFLARVSALPNLQIRGLMGIPPLAAQGDAARPYFAKLRKLFEAVSSNVLHPTSDVGRETIFNVLSMGMSSDFEIAIEEGSTMVRIGTALFGPRPANPPPD